MNNSIEIWKDILGYEDLYKVSNLGRIKSLVSSKKERILKSDRGGDYYNRVFLRKDKKTKTYRVHRLMAQTFLPNPENKPMVNHKDGNKLNNSLDNLEWCSSLENVRHARKSGLCDNSGKKHFNFKGIIKSINNLGEVVRVFCGRKDIESAGYCNSCIYKIVNTGKPYRGLIFVREKE